MNKKLRQILCAGMAAAVFAAAEVPASAASAADFTDVPANAWYYEAVDYAASEKLFAGMGDGKFAPNLPMMRGMFVTVLGRKAGVDKGKYTSSGFSDVKPNDWYGPYVEWAAEKGIVSGIGEGKFDPNGSITREQMAAMLYRYAKVIGQGNIQNGTEILRFPDAGEVADWAKEPMTWAVDKKIINGSDGKLRPRDTATRAQVAQVFFKAKDVLTGTEPVEPPEEQPDVATITLTPVQQAALAPSQDPQEVVRLVAAGTKAKWDESLTESDGYCMDIMLFGFTPDGQYTTDHAIYNTLEYLNNIGADRYRILIFTDPSYLLEGRPVSGLQLVYTVPKKSDSAVVSKAREMVEAKYPNARFTPDVIRTGNGWRGYTRTDSPSEVAEREIGYLSEWYSTGDTFNYWISEPEPGKFYYFY